MFITAAMAATKLSERSIQTLLHSK
jgi:hypothetical protein